jgi:hypothetical protein
MSEIKNTYYIQMATGEISRSSTDSPWNFKIEATDEEITEMREIFDNNHSTDWQGFYRAHVPYVQYHYDRENDDYDDNLRKAYKMIHELGDDDAKQHIESMGILNPDGPKDHL